MIATDIGEVANSLRLFVAPGDIGEIRVIGRGATFGLYFGHADIDAAAKFAAKYSTTAKGVYVVMNRLCSACGWVCRRRR